MTEIDRHHVLIQIDRATERDLHALVRGFERNEVPRGPLSILWYDAADRPDVLALAYLAAQSKLHHGETSSSDSLAARAAAGGCPEVRFRNLLRATRLELRHWSALGRYCDWRADWRDAAELAETTPRSIKGKQLRERLEAEFKAAQQ